MTPAHLKYFRKHFALTQKQAAALLKAEKKDWLRWELGIDPIPPLTGKRLRMWSKRLTEALARKDNWCWFCRKNVSRARAKGIEYCPYCNRKLTRPLKERIVEVLPARDLWHERYQQRFQNQG